jgi:hypothetical protein
MENLHLGKVISEVRSSNLPLSAQAVGNSCAFGHCKIMVPHAVPKQKSRQKHSLGKAIYFV